MEFTRMRCYYVKQAFMKEDARKVSPGSYVSEGNWIIEKILDDYDWVDRPDRRGLQVVSKANPSSSDEGGTGQAKCTEWF
jgi:hypothetical protein